MADRISQHSLSTILSKGERVMSDVMEFNDDNFEQEVLQAKEPVFVKFYTPT